MTRIDAVLPTVSVAALERELWAEAYNPHGNAESADGTSQDRDDAQVSDASQSADEDRTMTQRIADAFTARLLWGPAAASGEKPEQTADRHAAAPVNAKISILVPAETLTGDSNAPAISEDKSFALPAAEVRKIANDPRAQHSWYAAGITHNTQGDTEVTTVVSLGARNPPVQAQRTVATTSAVNPLTSTSTARFSTGKLRESILLRDRICQAQGCVRPGWAADIDHKTPHEQGGETSAANLWTLCREHHDMKARGLLHMPGAARLDHPPDRISSPGDPPESAVSVQPQDLRQSRLSRRSAPG